MLFYGQFMQQHHGLDPAGDIKEGRRLVQQDDRALLRQGFSNHGFLPFTVAQFGYVVLRFMGNAGSRQRLFDNLPVGFSSTVRRNRCTDDGPKTPVRKR